MNYHEFKKLKIRVIRIKRYFHVNFREWIIN